MPNQFLSPEGDLENYFVTESWLIDQYIGDTLWVWGRNRYGGLGINAAALQTTGRSTPVTTFAGGTNWAQFSSGVYHKAGIKTDGTLWIWGNNADRQLGAFNGADILTPITTFAGGTNWKTVSCGGYFTAALKTDGTLWTWGNWGSPQGTFNLNPSCTPVTTFAGGTNWRQVSAGMSFAAAVKTDGTLWTWGINSYGQLGINATGGGRCTPVTTFAGGTNWKQVSCAGYQMSAIKTDGTLWTWGRNNYGQLGDNTSIRKSTPVTTFSGGTNWKQVSTGTRSTTAIKTDGTLWLWGNGGIGQLGNNRSTDISTPVTTFSGGTNWKQVSCMGYYVSALKTDGTLWVWGSNYGAGLGVNDTIDRSTPVTTFAGGTNWKQVASGHSFFAGGMAALTSGTDPTFFIA